MDTENETTDLLKKLEPWIRKVAYSYTQDSGLRADLFQEGWIAAWQAIEKSNGENVESFAKRAVTWRITSVLSQGTMFGNKANWGAASKLVPTAMYHEDSNDKMLEVWHSLVENNMGQDLALHYDEIHLAIKTLTDRQAEYIRMRFWEHMDTPELTKYFGYEPWGLWKAARKKLVPTLEHLKEVV